MPAWSWSLPSVGDTFSTLTCFRVTGSAPKRMSLARLSASSCVKLPEITAVPPNDVKAASLGWMVGADCTRPSSTIATCLWNCCWASASHLLLPEPVRSIFTVQP